VRPEEYVIGVPLEPNELRHRLTRALQRHQADDDYHDCSISVDECCGDVVLAELDRWQAECAFRAVKLDQIQPVPEDVSSPARSPRAWKYGFDCHCSVIEGVHGPSAHASSRDEETP
jgi:hypothetical protein